MKYSILITTSAVMIAAATPSSFAAGATVGVDGQVDANALVRAPAASDKVETGSTADAEVTIFGE